MFWRELPTELWGLIAYNLKFELDLYKHCSLVNHQLYTIITQLYNKIPNKITIGTHMLDGWNYELETIDRETIDSCDYELNHENMWPMSENFIMSRNELLLGKKYYLVFYFDGNMYCYILQLRIKNCLDDDLNQMCHDIGICDDNPVLEVVYYK